LWNENAKDYEEVTPRHHKFKELKVHKLNNRLNKKHVQKKSLFFR
jgi:hypothetical protein